MEKFENYLGELPLTKVIKERIKDVLDMNLKIKNFEIKDIFVCELKNKEGARTYTSLWLFTDNYFIECKEFINKFDFDVTPYTNEIIYCSIAPVNFDFENANELSILKADCALGNNLTCNFIATGQNCLSLFTLYKKYIIPNMIK